MKHFVTFSLAMFLIVMPCLADYKQQTLSTWCSDCDPSRPLSGQCCVTLIGICESFSRFPVSISTIDFVARTDIMGGAVGYTFDNMSSQILSSYCASWSMTPAFSVQTSHRCRINRLATYIVNAGLPYGTQIAYSMDMNRQCYWTFWT